MKAFDTSLRGKLETGGFAVYERFKSAAEIAELRARAEKIVDDFDPSVAFGIFATTGERAHHNTSYFIESANTVRCFFEEEAFGEKGELKQPKALSINKIGHAMHDLDPVFERFSHGAALDAVAHDAGLTDPRIYQSMYIFKQPNIGGEVRWHQDGTYFVTDPHSVITFWFALEDADRNNGCLWVQPGGHHGPLREEFVLENGAAKSLHLDPTPYPTQDEAIPIECESGTLVVFHGHLPHYSAPNRSPKSRHAYTLHVVDGKAKYAPGNWIQRDASFPARGFV